MDGRGAWKDNVFIERLWRTLKYEEVYLRAYESVSAARESIARYLAFYARRPHTANDDLIRMPHTLARCRSARQLDGETARLITYGRLKSCSKKRDPLCLEW